MTELIAIILAVLKDIIPSKDLPTAVWASRIFVIVFAIIGSFYMLFFLLGDTQIAADYGFKKVIAESSQSVVELSLRRQRITGSMKTIYDKYSNVNSIFLAIPYQSSTQVFNYKDTSKNNKILMFAWLKPFAPNQFVFVEHNFEQKVAAFKSEYLDKTDCIYEPISNEVIAKNKAIIGGDFDATNIVACPITDKAITPFTIAYVLVFYKEPIVGSKFSGSDIFFNFDIDIMTRNIREIILASAGTYIN